MTCGGPFFQLSFDSMSAPLARLEGQASFLAMVGPGWIWAAESFVGGHAGSAVVWLCSLGSPCAVAWLFPPHSDAESPWCWSWGWVPVGFLLGQLWGVCGLLHQRMPPAPLHPCRVPLLPLTGGGGR